MKAAPRTFILIAIFINMMGVGLAWPVLPKLIEHLAGGGISEAALLYGLIATVYALAQFGFSPMLGNLSDAYGRKPVLLMSQAGLAADYAIMAIAPNLWWLAAARLVAGILGATISTAHAYMADISRPEDRSRNFGYIGAAFGVGFIAGPMIGGLLGHVDLRLPFAVASALCAANFLFGLAALPESLAANRRRPFEIAQSSPFRAIARMSRFPSLLGLFAALFITAVGQRGLEAVWVLYSSFRFGWGVREAAFSLAFVGVMFVITQGMLVGPIVARFGEWRTVICGFLGSACALFCLGLVDKGWLAYPLIAAHILGNALAGPALNAICSRTVPETEQGALQGTLNSINSVAIIVGPLAASMVLSAISREDPIFGLPGAWFLLASLLFLLASAGVWRRHRAIPA